MSNPFERSGLASIDDLSTATWKSLFSHLESIQKEFLAVQPHTPGYPWPRDPLHNFIRVWEYPFVYNHLKAQFAKAVAGIPPKVVDLGSGATFFPFAVARLGWDVITVDADRRATSSMDRAIVELSTAPGSVRTLESDARAIDLESESVDCVYCISVLEHIPDFESVVAEAHRILRPSGLFLLTFDIDLNGNFELGPDAFSRLRGVLDYRFSPVYPERVTHPLRILTSENSLYPAYQRMSLSRRLTRSLKRRIRVLCNSLGLAEPPSGRLLLSTFGGSLQKRALLTQTASSSQQEPTRVDSQL
ncbi:MAG: class I SAM-dependent methyltransferase [Bryobacterales bacterium]|nr:class I SAM-dependent methyltransferase [Bryobacterales bacterium]